MDFRPATPDRLEVLWAGVQDEHRRRPAAIWTRALQGVFGVESIAAGGHKLALTLADGTFEDYVRPMISQPWSPAAAGERLLDGHDLVALAYAGDAAGSGANSQIYLEALELP